MVLTAPGRPLELRDQPRPRPGPGQVLLQVHACGLCRTDLHIVDGELTDPRLPLIPGHQIVGTVMESGEGAQRLATGTRVGVPWLGWTCGECRQCRAGRENLCERARFTGYQVDGGYAEFAATSRRAGSRLTPSGWRSTCSPTTSRAGSAAPALVSAS